MSLRVRITGAEKLAKALPDPVKAERAIRKGARRYAATKGRTIVREHTPVDTGVLKASWVPSTGAGTRRKFPLLENRTRYAEHALEGRGRGPMSPKRSRNLRRWRQGLDRFRDGLRGVLEDVAEKATKEGR